jgi:hypothetical protein
VLIPPSSGDRRGEFGHYLDGIADHFGDGVAELLGERTGIPNPAGKPVS